MRLLLAGFEPFGGDAVNPSMLAVERVRDDLPAGFWAATVVLPVRYDRAWERLRHALDAGPDVVLLTGLAAGRAGLSVERVAINLDDAPIPDNCGARRRDEPVVPGGPAAYFTTLPARAMVEACLAAGVPAQLSRDAGTFLCNHVLYRLCHHATTADRRLRCGFVHLPLLPAQAAARSGPPPPSMGLDAIAAGLRAMLGAVGDVRPG